MLHFAPDNVRMDRAVENYPSFPSDFGELAYRWSEFSNSPILGDPRAATAAKGRAIPDRAVERVAEMAVALYARQKTQSVWIQPNPPHRYAGAMRLRLPSAEAR